MHVVKDSLLKQTHLSALSWLGHGCGPVVPSLATLFHHTPCFDSHHRRLSTGDLSDLSASGTGHTGRWHSGCPWCSQLYGQTSFLWPWITTTQQLLHRSDAARSVTLRFCPNGNPIASTRLQAWPESAWAVAVVPQEQVPRCHTGGTQGDSHWNHPRLFHGTIPNSSSSEPEKSLKRFSFSNSSSSQNLSEK